MATEMKPWHAFVILAFALLPALNSIDVCLEHDTWWHLAIGQSIVRNGAVPETDPLSRMSQEKPTPWRAYSWLYEVLVFEIFERFSFIGLLFFRTLLVAMSTVTVLAFLLRRGGVSVISLFAGILMMATLMMLAKERPWHFTITFTTLTLWCVQALRNGMKWQHALWLPPMFAVWANLHIQFVLGWGILGLACIFPGHANRAGMIAVTAGCFAATAVNPYHLHLLEVIWEYATQAAPLRLVQELSPPDWFETSTIATALLLGIGLTAVLQKKPLDLFELLLLITAAVLAARMRRDIWFAGLAGIAMLRTEIKPNAKQIAMTISLIVILMFGLRIAEVINNGRGYDYAAAQQKRFPYDAVKAIQYHRSAGPVFNEFDWGGYLSWNLPEYPVSIDGRTNLYGNERMMNSFSSWSQENGTANDPEFQSANIVIAPKKRLLTDELRNNSQWIILHEDDLAVVFIRKK